ncbi:tetratricopeptide repeat protein [Thioalkalivibrio sp. XN8]|uniref:tetratricopeptide repeat protein n=1 Tax=Thioalkalivibrio sp. XN8 TaxID=2712863 RepID=UPI0013EC6E18|nr:tetratricopeptide repeat protein [Thioalkalivibrio sp. XN8]NGP54211.1 tetratricopeptide repeat protein [Thioalkalivibrio sp. XN8]
MSNRGTRSNLPALAVALLLAAGAAGAGGMALWPEAAAAQAQQTRKTPAMRESVFRELSQAQSVADTGDIAEALRLLDRVKQRDDLNSYELAQLYNFYAFIYYSQEQYAKSIEAYRNLLSQPDLPEALEVSTLYGIAQLSLVTEDYAGAVGYLERWFRLVPDPGPDAYVLLSQAYYQQGQVEKALVPIENAMRLAREQGTAAKENWLLLARALNFELERYGQVVDVLEQLLTDYPRQEYWVQLAAMYGETGREREQLVAYEIAYEQGYLDKDRELVLLAQLYLQQDVPYKAARVLEDGMAKGAVERSARNLRLLSQAWTLAMNNEEAIAALQEAASLSGDPELYLRLAQQYAGLSRWEDALGAARTALDRGIDDRADAHLMVGMALYNVGRLDEAVGNFRQAAADERLAVTARQWIDYIGKEKERREQIAQAG